MKIIDLTEEYYDLFCVCLEDWSDEMKEAGDHRSCWFQKFKEKGLRAKLALDDDGVVGGMIQYLPSEHAPIIGENLYYTPCIWVHGHKKGRGNFQKKGMGKALLKAAEEDVADLGAGGLVVWGVSLPIWMKAKWYKKQGYQQIDKNGMAVLLWKPFKEDAKAPRWIKGEKLPTPVPGKVTVSGFINGWCSAQNINYERARRVAAEFGDKVEFQTFDTSNRETLLEWGISDGIFIDDQEISTGPPLTEKKARKHIKKRLRKII